MKMYEHRKKNFCLRKFFSLFRARLGVDDLQVVGFSNETEPQTSCPIRQKLEESPVAATQPKERPSKQTQQANPVAQSRHSNGSLC